MFFWWTIERPPRNEPDETDCARDDECRAPSPLERNHRHHKWRDERADVGSRVENAGSQRAFLFGKPLSNCLDRSGEISSFTKAKKETSDTKPQHRAGQGMGHRRQAPEDDRQRKSFARADAIDETADAEKADGVRCLKREYDPTVINLAPMNLVLNG